MKSLLKKLTENIFVKESYTYVGEAGSLQEMLVVHLYGGKRFYVLYNRGDFRNFNLKRAYKKVVKKVKKKTGKKLIPSVPPPELIGRKHRT